jgi:DNA-binding NtrC family response regulator
MDKVLIIDDDEWNRQIMKETLRTEGYQLFEAIDGESGITAVRKENPDVVITDYLMPGINGLEVLIETHKIKSSLPVILLTGFGDVGLTIKSIQLGAFDYLEKPVKSSHLKTVVREALNSVKISSSLNEVIPTTSPLYWSITCLSAKPPR